MKQPKRATPPLAVGQIWELSDSTIEITLVGRTLVHYKRAPHGMKRVPTSLLNKDALEKYLRESKAVIKTSGPPNRQTKLRVTSAA